jgi:hypothetical protein
MFISERKYAFPCITLPASRSAYTRSTYFYPGSRVIEIADVVSPCAVRTLISVSARQPSISSVFCASRRGNRRRFVVFSFFLFILPFCLGKRIDFRSVEFLVFFPCRIYRSGCHSSGAALPRPTGSFRIL